ncbi:hypothetical protein V6N12_074777 [Hibiscus sabdariffa]|uniref:Retrotransposon gag domain-containing protein n=1 Tax=Hibiscus sabdariffa TaxID=183260 RepID=A0ABR2D2T3_9ROSI
MCTFSPSEDVTFVLPKRVVPETPLLKEIVSRWKGIFLDKRNLKPWFNQKTRTTSKSHTTPEPAQAPQNFPEVQAVQRECLLSMKGMFDQLISNLRQEHPMVQVVVVPNQAPIEKLSQHRGYTFTGTIEEKPEEVEYWLERTAQIVTKQLSCSDEHKLECVVTLLVDEALSWWETTTLTAPAEKITWKFFVEKFKKKYISEQYLNDRRNRFLHLKQANKPIEQYVAEFCKYCKYGAEYIKTKNDKRQKLTDGMNDDLGPMFM